jgi:FtsP/CotA-like multicopper oxidase with cupredoxin domain
MRIARRALFRLGALGGALGLAAGFWPLARARRAPEPRASAELDCDPAATGGNYAARYRPPEYVLAGSRDALHTPPAPGSQAPGSVQDVRLSIIETTLEVASRSSLAVYAFDGVVPGPILRAPVGSRLRVTLDNRSNLPHSLHFHGAHDVAQDGLGRVAPAATQVYDLEAGPVGLHPYHCHVPPYSWHMAKGMYGAFIVDPPEPRPPAHEFVLCLSGFDLDGDGRNEIYAWNGVAGYYERYPIKVPVGELVRLYVLNMVEHDPLATFHLHAQTFDVYRSGGGLAPSEHTDVISLGQTERAMIEFRLPRRGRYMFHPHQSHMAERGAMGYVVAI